ncbi:unnamed protein product [Gordionus sp. m RMFG-2023]
MYGIGDITAQTIDRYKKGARHYPHSYKRTAILIGFGVFNAGPLMRSWYSFLDKSFGTQKSFRYGFKKMVIDQVFFAPIFLLNYLVTPEILKNGNFSTIDQKIEKDYIYIMKANYKIWPFVQLINMSMVPLIYRVLVTNIVSFMFNTYISYTINK